MNNEFKNNILEGLKKYYGNEAKVCFRDVLKNNGTRKTGIYIMFDDNNKTVPVLYLENYYNAYKEGYISIEDIINEIASLRKNSECDEPTKLFAGDLLEYEKIKSNIFPVLINKEDNKEMLEHLVWKPFLDLAIIYIVRGDLTKEGFASVKISTTISKYWGKTTEKIHESAMSNLVDDGYTYRDIKSVMLDILEFDEAEMKELDINESGSSFHVITNKCKMYGAAGMLNTEFIASKLQGESAYIIPSSVHECLVIPADMETDVESLNSMVREVNESDVLPEEILSDHVYYFDGEAVEVRMTNE